jgi:hypothetical protein
MENRMSKQLEIDTQNLLNKMSAQQEQLAADNELRRKNFIPKYLREKSPEWSVYSNKGLSDQNSR